MYAHIYIQIYIHIYIFMYVIFTSIYMHSPIDIYTHAWPYCAQTIKTRQVLQGGTTISLIQGIVKNEGVSGMYKGISPALLRAVISGGGRLAGYNFLKNRAIKMGALNPSGAATASEIPLRGVLAISAAVTAQLIAAPLDLIRTRQSMSAETSPSMQRVVKEILASHGVRGLFAGTTALLGRTVTFNFGQLLTYDAARSRAARWGAAKIVYRYLYIYIYIYICLHIYIYI